jgi:predicted phage tail protein
MDCHEKDIGFEVDIADTKLEYEVEMLMNLQEGDVTITPIPAGSKSGGSKILAAIALAALFMTPLGPALFTAGQAATPALVLSTGGTQAAIAATAGVFSVPGMLVAGLAVNLAMMGLNQMMSPDPATDADQEQNYLFNGNQQNIVEGDPVPVLYGKLRVPGQPINFEVAANQANKWKSVFLNYDGSSSLLGGGS